MRPGGRGPRALGIAGLLAVVLAAGLLLGGSHGLAAPPVRGSLPSSRAPPSPTTAPASLSGGVGGNVTWNGANVSAAGSTGSAFVVHGGASATVAFFYTVFPGGPAPVTAEVVGVFLGYPLTSVGTGTSPGTGGVGGAEFSWSFGTLWELTEGSYHLTAELLDANGSIVWSEGFYVNVEAPYRVASGIFVFLIVLGGVESYTVATVLTERWARRRRRATRPPPRPGSPTVPRASAGGPGTIALTAATSGAVLGLVGMLVLQQLGFLALTGFLFSVLLLAGTAALWAAIFGVAGYLVERH
jgi:hypothetical protein